MLAVGAHRDRHGARTATGAADSRRAASFAATLSRRRARLDAAPAAAGGASARRMV